MTKDAADLTITRLNVNHCHEIQRCFQQVYGDTYANELFYDTEALAAALESSTLRSVGALNAAGEVIAHMAMVLPSTDCIYPELGNTVVDPRARGGGLAWRVGAELRAWSEELGYTGFVHYPTTDHHIMQRQSVKQGFELGVMLGYIPAQTDGKVKDDPARMLRGAATIVFEPYGQPQPILQVFMPARFDEVIRQVAEHANLEREWHTCQEPKGATKLEVVSLAKRGLTRILVRHGGDDFDAVLNLAMRAPQECVQLDFLMDDPGMDACVERATDSGFLFCGWLPGRYHTDVLRLQWVEESRTDMQPGVVNPVAKRLLTETIHVA